jgi:sec-independent protein translocase protein TatC
MAGIRAIGQDEHLTIVEHLDELRSRLIVCGAVLAAAAAVCFWQNHLLLSIVNAPLPAHREPLTFGVTEPFTTTVTVVAYAAILISLPVILHQLYSYVLPAFAERERRVILPLLVVIPVLFVIGVTFAYFVVIPAALKFLLHFNDTEFDIQIRARDYYTFILTTTIAVGVIFQLPVGILAVTRLGIVTPEQLSGNRRYAYLVIAVVAAALPGVDPVSMLLEMAPLLVLYEISIVLARAFGQPAGTPLTDLT